MARCSFRRNGFSLLELLVSIAVIALLAALAISVVGQFTVKSRSITCTSRVKEITLAMLSYINDHNGMLPPGNEPAGRELFLADSPSWGGTGPTWNEYLLKFYLSGNAALFQCPAVPPVFSSGRGAYPHYAYNERLANLDPPPRNERNAVTRYRTIASIPFHAKKVLIADSTRWANGVPIGGAYNINDASKIHPRHGSRATVAHLDGHLELITLPPGSVYPQGLERDKFTPED